MTVPVPLLRATVLLEAVVSKSVPVMISVVAVAARLLLFKVTVGAAGAVTFAVCPVKAMLFKSTLALAEPKLAVMMSSLPSPFTSPKVTDIGLVPVAKSVLV